jgi:D-serine deaminase-like pyridoxal phosphate-dependent protein
VVREAIAQLVATATQCRNAGLPMEVVSAGGSVTLDTTPFLPGVTEIQAGGATFCDVYFRQMQSVTSPALYVCSTVSSRPAADRLVFDAGFKALPAWKRVPEPVNLPGVASISMSAEHGVVTLHEPNESVRVGDAYDFIRVR